jgi:hypothetical protein
MLLDSRALTTAQLCPRRWALEKAEPRGRWHPKSLFDAILRQGILALSSCTPKAQVTLEAQARFRTIAKSPGLDTLADPWTLSQDFCACLETILEALSRLTLLQVSPGPMARLGAELEWRVSAFADESGALHRWATVERADSDTLARELHSWHVAGDMAAAGVPLTLHLIEIGSQRAGRRHSPWCKTFKHPVVAGHYKFRGRGGEALKGDWKPVWYAQAPQDASKWVDLMQGDRLALIHHLEVKQLSAAQSDEIKAQIYEEAKRLSILGHWREIPMSRPSCDWPYTCPHQFRCFGATSKPATLPHRPIGKPRD